MRYQSLFISICAVSLVLLLLMPAASAVKIVVNATHDGSVGTGEDANWSTMRTAEGNAVRLSQDKTWCGMTEAINDIPDTYDDHWRALVTWDTSDIPDDATITSAIVSVYGAPHKMNELGTVDFSIIDADPTNPLVYTGGDYSRTTFTRMADDIPFNSFTIVDYPPTIVTSNNLSLNPSGISHISKTGLTTFMFTHSADVDKSSLTWLPGPDPSNETQASGFNIKGLMNLSGAYTPFITINYELHVVTPVAIFMPNVTTGTSPLTVKFTDTSTNSPTSWNWSFGDGTWFNTTVATERNAMHTYTTPSTYIVKLTVANADGSNTTSPGTTITVNAAPISTTDKVGIYKNGVWYLDNSGNGAWGAGDSVYSFGALGYTSITGDWNATGFTYIGIYKDGVWYLDWNGNGAWDGVDKSYSFGAPGWVPVVGDWNNDKKTDIGVTNGQQWYLDMNNNGVYDNGVDKAYSFGAPGWVPVVGDWSATGFTYIGIYKDGVWYLDWNGNGAWDGGDSAYSFGAPGWVPVVGDWNNDKKTDVGVANGQQWYLDMNNNGAYDSGVDKAYSFGAPGWTPIVGDWSATGFTYIGVTNGQQWYLDWNGNGAWDGVDKAYSFGAPGWTPVVGRWG